MFCFCTVHSIFWKKRVCYDKDWIETFSFFCKWQKVPTVCLLGAKDADNETRNVATLYLGNKISYKIVQKDGKACNSFWLYLSSLRKTLTLFFKRLSKFRNLSDADSSSMVFILSSSSISFITYYLFLMNTRSSFIYFLFIKNMI